MPEHLSVTHNRSKVLCMKCSLLVIAVLVVVVLVYLPAARYSLVYDDHEQLETNPRLTDWRHVPGYFTTHLWAHSPLQAPNYYRPLSLLFFRVEYAVGGHPALAFASCLGVRNYLPVWESDLTLFTRAVEQAPRNPYVKNNLADAYLKANRTAEAFPLLQQAIKLKPDYGLLYYNMARYYRMIGDYRESERYFTISDRLYPGR